MSSNEEKQPTEPKLPDSEGWWWWRDEIFAGTEPVIYWPVEVAWYYPDYTSKSKKFLCRRTEAGKYESLDSGEWGPPCRPEDAQLRQRIEKRIEELEAEPELGVCGTVSTLHTQKFCRKYRHQTDWITFEDKVKIARIAELRRLLEP